MTKHLAGAVSVNKYVRARELMHKAGVELQTEMPELQAVAQEQAANAARHIKTLTRRCMKALQQQAIEIAAIAVQQLIPTMADAPFKKAKAAAAKAKAKAAAAEEKPAAPWAYLMSDSDEEDETTLGAAHRRQDAQHVAVRGWHRYTGCHLGVRDQPPTWAELEKKELESVEDCALLDFRRRPGMPFSSCG